MDAVIQVEASDLHREISDRLPVLLLDVRNPRDVDVERIEGPGVRRIHIPYYELLEETDALLSKLPQDRVITVVCCKGNASLFVCRLLAEHGFAVRNLIGGMAGWTCLRPVG